jgi:hypothetical protein
LPDLAGALFVPRQGLSIAIEIALVSSLVAEIFSPVGRCAVTESVPAYCNFCPVLSTTSVVLSASNATSVSVLRATLIRSIPAIAAGSMSDFAALSDDAAAIALKLRRLATAVLTAIPRKSGPLLSIVSMRQSGRNSGRPIARPADCPPIAMTAINIRLSLRQYGRTIYK